MSTAPMVHTAKSSAFRVVRTYFRLPPEPGGMESHIARLSKAQRDLGVDVLNVYNMGRPSGPSVCIYDGFDLLRIRPAFLRNAIFYAGALAAKKNLKGSLPTVLHVHGDWSDFLFSKVLARAIGAEMVVASLHDIVKRENDNLYKISLSHCKLVFATGKGDQLYLQQLLGRSVYHLPSAPLDIFFSPPTERVEKRWDVICVANFFRKKRLDLVVECAVKRPHLRFVLLGDGPEWEKIVERVKREGITNLDLPGRVSPDEIAAAMSMARMFLSTSESEGTPTAVLEAMAVGLPVVLTPSNEYGWLIEPGMNGFVTRGWDVDEILDHIDEVLADEPRRTVMSQLNRECASKHTWRENAKLVSALMAERLGLEWEEPCVV